VPSRSFFIASIEHTAVLTTTAKEFAFFNTPAKYPFFHPFSKGIVVIAEKMYLLAKIFDFCFIAIFGNVLIQ
jgi:hypothetical protein